MALDATLLDADATSLVGIAATRDDIVGKPFWVASWFKATPGMSETVRAAIPTVANGEIVQLEIHLNLPRRGMAMVRFPDAPCPRRERHGRRDHA